MENVELVTTTGVRSQEVYYHRISAEELKGGDIAFFNNWHGSESIICMIDDKEAMFYNSVNKHNVFKIHESTDPDCNLPYPELYKKFVELKEKIYNCK